MTTLESTRQGSRKLENLLNLIKLSKSAGQKTASLAQDTEPETGQFVLDLEQEQAIASVQVLTANLSRIK